MLLTVQADQAFEPSGDPDTSSGAGPHIMLSSGCSEIGTGSSNSPRSANESVRTDTGSWRHFVGSTKTGLSERSTRARLTMLTKVAASRSSAGT
jgi:hypothetical protein